LLIMDEASLVTVVSLYGRKSGPLRDLLTAVQAAAGRELGAAFRPYSLEQVHGTLVVLSGWRDAGPTGAVLNQHFLQYRGLRAPMDFDRAQQIVCERLAAPLAVRIGGVGPADPVPVTSQGQHLHERSFSASGGALVLMGWPLISLESAGSQRPLDDLRRRMAEAGVLHRYHPKPDDLDDDFHLVVGHHVGAPPQAVTAAVRAVRLLLARNPVEVRIGLEQVLLVAADSPDLAAPRFCARLPQPAGVVAAQYR
jgi:hypothetical protein